MTTKEMKKPPFDDQMVGAAVVEEGVEMEAGGRKAAGIVDDTTERDRAVV